MNIDGMTQQTPLVSRLLANGAVLAILVAVPAWVVRFGWLSLKAWRVAGSIGPAVAMTLPALAIILPFACANLGNA